MKASVFTQTGIELWIKQGCYGDNQEINVKAKATWQKSETHMFSLDGKKFYLDTESCYFEMSDEEAHHQKKNLFAQKHLSCFNFLFFCPLWFETNLCGNTV